VYAHRFEQFLALSVLRLHIFVRTAVDFDCQMALVTIEIEYEPTDRMLSSEFPPVKFRVSERSPKDIFRASWLST